MKTMYFENDGKTYKRITRRQAAKAFKNDRICVYPCNMYPFGIWGMGVWITDCGRSFEQIVNEFEFYNCNNETGRYAAFCVEV